MSFIPENEKLTKTSVSLQIKGNKGNRAVEVTKTFEEAEEGWEKLNYTCNVGDNTWTHAEQVSFCTL